MLDKINQCKWLIIVSFILLVIPFYLTNKNSQESSTLKTAFEKQDRIAVLHYLMTSEKYDLRKKWNIEKLSWDSAKYLEKIF